MSTAHIHRFSKHVDREVCVWQIFQDILFRIDKQFFVKHSWCCVSTSASTTNKSMSLNSKLTINSLNEHLYRKWLWKIVVGNCCFLIAFNINGSLILSNLKNLYILCFRIIAKTSTEFLARQAFHPTLIQNNIRFLIVNKFKSFLHHCRTLNIIMHVQLTWKVSNEILVVINNKHIILWCMTACIAFIRSFILHIFFLCAKLLGTNLFCQSVHILKAHLITLLLKCLLQAVKHWEHLESLVMHIFKFLFLRLVGLLVNHRCERRNHIRHRTAKLIRNFLQSLLLHVCLVNLT